jgi:hypothetical protein
MKKLLVVVAVILGMTATSKGQAQVEQVYDGKIVDGRSHNKIHTKLDIDFEGMSVENVKPYVAVDVFKVVLDADTIYEYIGDKFRFAVTDDKWNYLELEVFVDFYEQVTFKGKYNGEAFHSDGEDFIFDNSKKYAKVNYKFH